MATGVVTWSNAIKGFGFIQPDEGTEDVFVHVSAVERAGPSDLDAGRKPAAHRRSGKRATDELKAE